MGPDEVEQMLYEHAIRTKIRAPKSERIANLGYSRVVTGGIVAGAALACSLVMSKSGHATGSKEVYLTDAAHPQVSDTDLNSRPAYQLPVQSYRQESATSLAMAPVGS